jgi:tetratricopeptide (TPR) repeat protein
MPPKKPTGDQADLRIEEITRALGVSDTPRAATLAMAALEAGVEHPLLYNLGAWALEQEGKLAESADLLERGIDLYPDDVQLLATLGFTRIALEQRPEAVLVFEKTVEKYPDYAPARYGLGSVYGMLGEFDMAKAQYFRAVTLAPDYVDAVAGLADIAEKRHDREEARRLLAHALRMNPRHVDSRLQLAKIEYAAGELATAERMVRDILRDPELSPIGKSQALGILGDVLERMTRYDEAWEAYVESKGVLRGAYAKIYDAPGKVLAADATRRRTAEFARTNPKDWLEPPSEIARDKARSHVFLFGFARSGTTLLEQILASHPEIDALEERPTLYDTEIEFSHTAGGIERLARIHDRELDKYREAYWMRARNFDGAPDGKVFIDKFPMNSQHVPLIRKLFPEAKILFALRDPRDVVLSCFRRAFLLNVAMYEFTTIERTAHYYDAVMSGMALYRDRLALDLHTVRYEALVNDFEAETRAVCAFLGLQWTSDLIKFADTAKVRPVRTPSASQVARGLYREGMEQWRRYERQLEPVMATLRPWIEYYGYPMS